MHKDAKISENNLNSFMLVFMEISHRVLSGEYPYARVKIIFPGFKHNFVLAKLATSSIGRVDAWESY